MLFNLDYATAQKSDFESKGVQFSSSRVARIRTQASQEKWAIQNQATNLALAACTYNERAFSPLTPAINLFVVQFSLYTGWGKWFRNEM